MFLLFVTYVRGGRRGYPLGASKRQAASLVATVIYRVVVRFCETRLLLVDADSLNSLIAESH